MMLGIFNYWLLWILPFLAFTAIGFIIYALGEKKGRPAPGKYETYTCGERFRVTDIGHESFYGPIKKVLELSRLQRAHTGRLSDYLLMAVIGFVIVLLFVMVLI
jgi:hypothetical protein